MVDRFLLYAGVGGVGVPVCTGRLGMCWVKTDVLYAEERYKTPAGVCLIKDNENAGKWWLRIVVCLSLLLDQKGQKKLTCDSHRIFLNCCFGAAAYE
jgi:hypothetical protein